MEYYPLIEEIIMQLLYLVLLVIGGMAIKLLQKINSSEKARILREYAILQEEYAEKVVLYIQQVCKFYNDHYKFTRASSKLSEMFEARGINITEEEIELLIEATLKRLKKEFGDSWYNV